MELSQVLNTQEAGFIIAPKYALDGSTQRVGV